MEAENIKAINSAAYKAKDASSEIDAKIKTGEYTLEDKIGRSYIWSMFKRIINEDGQEIPYYVFCKVCKNVLRSFYSSNLRRHKCLNSKTSNAEKEISTNEDDSLSETSETSEIIDNKLSKLLRRWIIKECRPYDLLEGEGLKTIFQEIARLGSKLDGDIDASQLLPSYSQISENLTEIYEQCLETVKTGIASIKDEGFSLQVDICADNIKDQNYIAIGMHYLKNGVLVFRLLGLQPLKSANDLDRNVIDKIKQILENFECRLSSKTILVTNKNNIHIENKTDVQNLSCMSQLLTDALNESVQEVTEVKQIISAGSDLVNFLIKARQESVLGDFPNNCYNNCWLATFNMLNSIEDNWNKIEKVLKNMNEEEKMTQLNKQHLIAVTEVFQTLAEAIETLEDTSSATLHLVFVLLHELKKSFIKADIEEKQFQFIEKLKENIRYHLEKIAAEDLSILHKIALFLYPPTNQLLPFNVEEKECIENECLRLMQNYKQVSNPITGTELEKPNTPTPKRKKLFADFLACQTTQDPNKLLIQEIQCYKNTFVLNSEDFDVLNWWELHKGNFPLLYKLSCAVLSAPATCAASRRVFSASSNLINGKSTRCSKETEIEKIMFINSNAEPSFLAKC